MNGVEYRPWVNARAGAMRGLQKIGFLGRKLHSEDLYWISAAQRMVLAVGESR